ncbi:hypothetical protein B0J12DRAFT_713677 [Macrophomina phaseolina]|uniref:Smr domain-containing protein n=1 Tax=Macrophomina phaseolina TaxID=35725 RepID=A0ABQ8FXC0_9PEZI|nr:hypothetical protein B0J12DRAFT_713677 [Macrophomina phaseolina]
MDEDLARLQSEFCPPIDATIVMLIYEDYSSQPDAFERAHADLSTLRETAVLEQLTDFDPSGCSTQDGLLPEQGEGASLGHKSPTETDATSLTNGLSSLGLSSSGVSTPSETGANMTWLQNLDMSVKEARLIETFPTLSVNVVAYVLKKNKGDYERATDELLNHALFEEMDGDDGEEKILRKGIDSFAEGESVPRGRKTKAKKNKKKTTYTNLEEYARSSSEPAGPSQNKWHTATQDVDFIASKVNVPHRTIKSLYHERGGSVGSTITALIESDIETSKRSLEEESDIIVQNVADLSNEFSLDLPRAHALIRLTYPSSAAAHELAKALIRSSQTSATSAGGIELIARYAPLNLSEPDDEADVLAAAPLPSAGLGSGSLSAASLGAARHTAFNKASEYHRKGKSDPLMKAAAGYYGQLGRDQHRAYKTAVAAEADRLVARQSTDTQLDLHGVSVADAKRIARQRVAEWWDALGEERIREYAGGRARKEFRIITGVGRHSDGGKSKIGPAVVKMLVGEGWKVEVGSGAVTVTGLVRG